ncbi:MAG: hypothetical protein IKZ90_06075 [Clostridiales bacterium]|nr:hypothetical protein [Clostridiales bacterium]
MDNLKTIVEKRCALLRKCIQQAEKAAEADVSGHIEIVRHGNKRSFYLVRTPNSKKREYIRKEDYPLVKSIAAKDYAKRVIRRMRSELRVLERYIRCVESGSAEDVYSGLSRTRQELIRPLLVTDEVCAELWEAEPFQQSDYMPEMKIYPTKKGDMVRSKSEVLFANLYTDLGIPYRYEEEITLPDGQVMVPDFSLWDKKRRRVIYHEHFGKMDDPVYRKRNLKKIDDYRRNGIYSARNLIMTFEGEGTSLNMREMRAMIEDLIERS